MRDLALRMLESLGYRAIEVGDADQAMGALANNPEIDLVLSDVVLARGR